MEVAPAERRLPTRTPSAAVTEGEWGECLRSGGSRPGPTGQEMHRRREKWTRDNTKQTRTPPGHRSGGGGTANPHDHQRDGGPVTGGTGSRGRGRGRFRRRRG